MKYVVTLDGRIWEIVIDGSKVTVGGRDYQAELRSLQGTPVRLLTLDGRSWRLPMESAGRGSWSVVARGDLRTLEVVDERLAHIRSLVGTRAVPAGPLALKAPMPGLVVRVLAERGQKVVEGASLIVLEAMKMENELKAPRHGVVESVPVQTGQTVERGQVLITFRGT